MLRCPERPDSLMHPSSSNRDLKGRYSRQVLFAPIGPEGQKRLGTASAVVLGCGGLGTALASMLARAGVGRLRIVDRDRVEPSNLQRQILFDEEDARRGAFKAEAAARTLRRINSEIEIEGQVADIQPENIETLIEGANVVLDGLDNLETRFLLNDACAKHGIPWVYGACVASEGIVLTIVPGRTPCLRCVFESMPPPGTTPTCHTVGVVAPAVGLTASLQTAEALKILTGHPDRIVTKLRRFDLWSGRFQGIDVSAFRNQGNCPVCDERRFEYLEPR